MSLVGWWKFDESSGTVAYDSSINANNGTLVGTLTRVNGVIGNALNNNAAGHVSVPDKDYLDFGTTDFSISLWVKYPLGAVNPYWMLSHGTAYSAAGYSIACYQETDSTVPTVLYLHDGVTRLAVSVGNLSREVWHNITFTVNRTTDLMMSYLEGVYVATTDISTIGDISTTSILRLLGYSASDFIGDMDDVRIYNNVLSSKEIAELSKGQILHYRMDNFQEPTTNVVTNTNLDTGWSKSYCTGILWDDIDPPYGIDSPVVSFYDADEIPTQGYWYSYGDYAPQVPDTTYTVSLYIKTNDSNFRIQFYTADNSEVGRYSSEFITVPNDGQWHRIVWDAFLNPVGSESDSLSFHFTYGNPQGETQRTWLCAPQMEAKDHVTPFVIGSRSGTVEDASGYGNDAPLTEALTPEWVDEGKSGPGSYEFNGIVTTGNYITIPTQIIDLTSATIAFWARRNVLSVTQDVTNTVGSLRILYGSTSSRFLEMSVDDTYFEFRGERDVNSEYWAIIVSSVVADLNWHYYVITCDQNVTRLYIDGEYEGVDDDSGSGFTSDTCTITSIGRGYAPSPTYGSWWDGGLDDIRFYGSPLSADEAKELYELKASIDNYGQFYANQITETKYKNSKLIDYYADWIADTSGTQGDFAQNGATAENAVISAPDPFGKEDVKIWECTPDAVSGADGGWNNDFVSDDLTRYRFTVFVKRNNVNGTTYHGCLSCLTLGDVPNTNPYFWSGDPPSYDDWYLLVGLLHPSDYTGGDTGVSGVYDMNGKRVIAGTEFKMIVDSVSQRHRSYLYYCTDITTRQYMAYPRVDVVDGNEPTIMDLVNGTDSRLYDDLADMVTTDDYPLRVKETNVDISIINEVGPVFGLVAWWNFNEGTGLIAHDVSGNALNGTLANSPTWIGGIIGNALNFGGGEASVSIANSSVFDFGTGDFAISAWLKPSSVTTYNTYMEIGLYTAGILLRPTGGNLQVYLQSGLYTFTFSMVADNWYNVVVLRDNTSLQVFINTIQSGTGQTSVDNIAVASVGYIGRSAHTTGQNFLGIIDDVRIYNRALSASEREQLYEIGLDSKVKLYNDGTVYTRSVNEV
jgi:hypothetical protein